MGVSRVRGISSYCAEYAIICPSLANGVLGIMDMSKYIGAATAYDKKLMLEQKEPLSWLKSVNVFATTSGLTTKEISVLYHQGTL